MVQDTPTKAPSEAPAVGHAFVKIPGMGEEAAPQPGAMLSGEASIEDAVHGLRSASRDSFSSSLAALAAVPLTRTELHLLARTLLSMSRQPGEAGDAAAAALCGTISARRSSLEATFIGIQLIRLWGSDQSHPELLAGLTTAIEVEISALRFVPELSRKQLTEIRYVLIRAFETPALHLAALNVAHEVLADTSTRLISERKELAGALLSSASRVHTPTDALPSLKRLAAAVFATGVAPAHLIQRRSEPGRKRASFLVTAQDAERRRQFGLASAIELHKSTTLIGRGMTVAELELALSFHNDSSATFPGNQGWFSRDEWCTAYQLLSLALEEQSCAAEQAIVLLHALTKMKVEDPADTRVSFKRADLLDASFRRAKIADIEGRASGIGLSAEQLDAMSTERFLELVDPAFLVRNPASLSIYAEEPSQAPVAGRSAAGQSAINLSTEALVERIARDNNSTLISRLVAADFQLLKQAHGLTGVQFKNVLERIRARAISEPWARMAFLDILRAPHSAEVTPSLRTVALGALVSEARKLGKLSSSFEKEVFAVSAELPNLTWAEESPDLAKHDFSATS